MKSLTIYMFIFFISTSAIASDNFKKIDLIWKARGLQGTEKIEELNQKYKDESKKISKEDICKFKLETIYSNHINPETKKMAFSDLGSSKVYRLIFRDQEKLPVQINVSYGPNGDHAIYVVSVKDDWAVSMTPEINGYLGVRGKTCLYTIPISNPLAMRVMAL